MSRIFVPVGGTLDLNPEQIVRDLKAIGAERVYVTDVGRPFTRGEERRKIFARLKETCAFYEAAGFETGLWFCSIGFGGGFSHDERDFAAQFTRLHSVCGDEWGGGDAICPLDPEFKQLMVDWIEELVRCTGAKMLMLDDELCMSVRPGIGCTCDRHMAEYRRRLGEDISRKDVAKKVFTGGPSRYRDVWIDLMGDTLRDFCRAIAEAVKRADPTVRLGHCAGYTSWDLEGADEIELINILAGDNKPFMRFTGAPYWLANRRFDRQTLQTIIECTRMQYAWCKGTGIEVFAEADTYPRDRFHTPYAYSECFDLATRVSDDMDTLKYMYDYACEPTYDRGYVEAHCRNRPLYAQIDETFRGKTAVGIRIYEEMRKLRGADLPEVDVFTPADEQRVMRDIFFSHSQQLMTANAIPTVYDGQGICGAVFGENAKYLPDSALETGLILDCKAARILTARGIDVGLASAEPITGGFMERFDGAAHDTDLYDTSSVYSVGVKDGARVLSWFVSSQYPVGTRFPAAYLYENANGQRFLVYAFDGENQPDSSSLYWSHSRGEQIGDAMEWLCGEKLPARCDRNPHLYSLCKADATALAVAYINCNCDEIYDATVTFARPMKTMRFINCTGEQTDAITAKIHYVKAYGFAAIEGEFAD